MYASRHAHVHGVTHAWHACLDHASTHAWRISVHIPAHMSTRASVHMSVPMSVPMSVHMPVHMSTHGHYSATKTMALFVTVTKKFSDIYRDEGCYRE